MTGTGLGELAAAPRPGPLSWPFGDPHVAAAVGAGWLPGPSASSWMPALPQPAAWPPVPPAWPHAPMGTGLAAAADGAAVAERLLAELGFGPRQQARELEDAAGADDGAPAGMTLPAGPTRERGELELKAGRWRCRAAGRAGGARRCPRAAASRD